MLLFFPIVEFTPYLIKQLAEVTDTLRVMKNAIKPTIATIMLGHLVLRGLKWSNCAEGHNTLTYCAVAPR